MTRPLLERIHAGLVRAMEPPERRANRILQDFEAVLLYAEHLEVNGLSLARAIEDLAYACECNELLELGDVRRDVARLAVLARAYLAAHAGLEEQSP